MNNEIRTTPSLDDFLFMDKNMADVIREGAAAGIYVKTLSKLLPSEIREKILTMKNKTFCTQQEDAYIDLLERELLMRRGHPNEMVFEELMGSPLTDLQRDFFSVVKQAEEQGKQLLMVKKRHRFNG